MKNELKNKIIDLIDETIKYKKCTFISFIYSNKNAETSRYTIIVNFNKKGLIERDIAYLQSLTFKSNEENIAKNEIIESFLNTLKNNELGKHNDLYTKKDYYEYENSILKCKIENPEILYISGILIKKTVLVKGEYKEVKHSAKTLIKNKIKKGLKYPKFREFCINTEQLKSISIAKNRIFLE